MLAYLSMTNFRPHHDPRTSGATFACKRFTNITFYEERRKIDRQIRLWDLIQFVWKNLLVFTTNSSSSNLYSWTCILRKQNSPHELPFLPDKRKFGSLEDKNCTSHFFLPSPLQLVKIGDQSYELLDTLHSEHCILPHQSWKEVYLAKK